MEQSRRRFGEGNPSTELTYAEKKAWIDSERARLLRELEKLDKMEAKIKRDHRVVDSVFFEIERKDQPSDQEDQAGSRPLRLPARSRRDDEEDAGERPRPRGPRREGSGGARPFSRGPRREGSGGERPFSRGPRREGSGGERPFSRGPRREGSGGERPFSRGPRREGSGGARPFARGPRRDVVARPRRPKGDS